MRTDSIVRDAMLAARARPNDAAARAEVARAWLRVGKPEVALGWAREAYKLEKSEQYAALVRAISSMAKQQGRPQQWEVAPTALVGGPPDSPSLESQLNAMLGGRLFHEQTCVRPLTMVHSLGPARKGRTAFVSLLFVSFALGLVAAGAIVRDAKQSNQCATLTHDLEGFLRTGSLREADETLDRIRVLAQETGRTRELAPLMARAEATLYRYVDSSEERKHGVELMLAIGGEGTFDGVVARALITPPEELGETHDMLRAIATENKDPEAAFLVAVSLAVQGTNKEADRAFAKALDLEPANLPHLAHYARWLAHTKRATEAEEILDQMKTIDPESFWIGWIEEEIREGSA